MNHGFHYEAATEGRLDRLYDTAVMRKIVAMRKMKPDDLAEQEAILEIYKAAMGMS